MSNITLSIPDDVLEEAREYARKNKTSLNAMIRQFLDNTFKKPKKNSIEEFFAIADRAHTSSRGKKWKREDAYDL